MASDLSLSYSLLSLSLAFALAPPGKEEPSPDALGKPKVAHKETTQRNTWGEEPRLLTDGKHEPGDM